MNNNIFSIINQTTYNKLNYQKIIKFFLENFSSNSNSKIYLIERPILNEKIFVVRYELPVKFKNQTINVSLLIYFPSNFPFDIEFYLENRFNIAINNNYSNEVINRNTLRINLDFFCNWDKDKLNFSEIINTLQYNFNDSFPVFRSNISIENPGGCCNLNNIIQEIHLRNNQINNVILKNENNNNNINSNNNKSNLNFNNNLINNYDNNNINHNINKNNNINSMSYIVQNYQNINNPNISNYNINYIQNCNNNSANNNNYHYNNNNNNSYYNINNNNNNNKNINYNKDFKIINDKNDNNKNYKPNNYKESNDINNDEEMKKNIIEYICINIKNPLVKKMNELKEIKEQSIAYKQFEINKNKNGSLFNLPNNLNELQKLNQTLNVNENKIKYEINEIKKKLMKKITINEYEKYVNNVNSNVMFCSISSKTIDDFLISLKKLFEKRLISFEETKNLIRKFSREIFNLKFKRIKKIKSIIKC